MRALQRVVGNQATTGLLHPDVAATVARPGTPLDEDARHQMESRFGYDFAAVRVHTDSEASRSAESVDATAYTIGPHITFAAGQYDPRGAIGRRLLAHELAHVIQQSRGGGPSSGFDATDPLEHGAERAASAASVGTDRISVGGASAPGLARQAAPGSGQQAKDDAAPVGIHVTNRFTAGAELLRRAKVKVQAGDTQGALKLIDGVLNALKNAKYHSYETLRGLNGLAATDLEMIAGMGIDAVARLDVRIRSGPPPDEDLWKRSFREYIYARPVFEVLLGDTPLAQSKYAQGVNKAADTALIGVAAVSVAVIAVPLLIEGIPLVASAALEASPALYVYAAENAALVQIASEFVVGKILQVAAGGGLTLTIGEVIMLGIQVGGTMNMGSGRVTTVNEDGSGEITITSAPAKGGGPPPTAARGGTGTPPVGGEEGDVVPSTTGGTGAKGTTTTGTGGVTTPPPKVTTTTAAPTNGETETTEAQVSPKPSTTQGGTTRDARFPPSNPNTRPMQRPTPNSVYTSTRKTTSRSNIPSPPVEKVNRVKPPPSLDPNEETAGRMRAATQAQEKAQEHQAALPAGQREKTVAVGAEDEGKTPATQRTGAANQTAGAATQPTDQPKISGYKVIPESDQQASAEDVIAHSKEIGYDIQPHARDPRATGTAGTGEPEAGGEAGAGLYNAGHAEKKQIVARPNQPVGVGRPMCADCIAFFKREALFRGRPQVVSDPQATRVFDPDGQSVTEYWRDGSVVRYGPHGAQAQPSKPPQ